MAKYFITGISGFIGLELCRTLKMEGHDVVGLIHKNSPPELASLNITLVRANLHDHEKYKEYLQHCEYIVHLAGNPKFGNGPEYEEQNVTATANLLNAVTESAQKLRRFIFISTIGAIDRAKEDKCALPLTEISLPYPSSDYGKSKLKAEQMVRDAGLPYTIVRPTLVIGKKMRFASHVAVFARTAILKSILARIKWPGKISVIHVTDLASSISFLSQHPAAENRIFFAAGEEIAIGEIMHLANPAMFQLNIAPFVKILAMFARFMPFSLKAMLYPALTASDKALQELGWETSVSLQDGISEVINREEARVRANKNPSGWTIVTGAASGLGMELAVKLQAMGRKLILIDKDVNKLREVCSGHNDVIHLQCDLADWHETDVTIENELADDIKMHIVELYLCAGFGLRGEISKLLSTAQADILKVNVLSRLQLAHKYLPSMINNQFGRIVYISSSSAYQALPYMGVYAASNAAVLSLGESLAYENLANGVEVLTVCPGGMATNFQKMAGVKEIVGEKLMTPEIAADIIMRSLGKNKIVIMPGFRSFAMSIAARVLPRKLLLSLWGKLMSVAR